MTTSSPAVGADCLGWARTAGFTCTDRDGHLVFFSEADRATRYHLRRRGSDRLQLDQFDADADAETERPLLFVAEVMVLERFLFGLFADHIREDLDLPFLALPFTPADVADGFTVSEPIREHRTLIHATRGPVAAAPDPTLSLATLVPLSHLLLWSPAALKVSFLDELGAPLLQSDGSYATPPQ